MNVIIYDPDSWDLLPDFTPYEFVYQGGQCFAITQRIKGEAYMVDLEEYDGYGSCTCDHFIMKLKPGSGKTCKHINMTRVLWARKWRRKRPPQDKPFRMAEKIF